MRIESLRPFDRSQLLQLAVDTTLFTAEEAESLLGQILDGFASENMPQGHEAACYFGSGGEAPVGWCYFAPDDHAEGVWNLWWLGVTPKLHGSGAGHELLAHVERRVETEGGRLLVIETSASNELSRARRFYASHGYAECGRVPHFYAENESKVIFARQLPGAASQETPPK